MNDIFKLTPEDIAQYREQFSQNNQEEALYALDVIEEKNGNLIIAASELLDFGQKEKIVSVIITLTKSGNVPLSPVNLITEK
jgi:hypothetical protein